MTGTRAAICALYVMTALPAVAQCRQALALGFDVSGSVDAREYRLQIDGLAAALTDPDVRHAFLIAPETPVRLMMYEWSGPEDQRIVVPWTDIQTQTDLDQISIDLLATTPAQEREIDTAIAAAMMFGARQLMQQSTCWQRTLDISGDGPANVGVHPQAVTEAFLDGITVNGLVIVPNSRANTTKNRTNAKTLEVYYNSYVIRGPGAFVETADTHAVFAQAMRRKLIRELELPNLSQLHLPHDQPDR